MKWTRRTRIGETGIGALGISALIGAALLLSGCGADQQAEAESSKPQVDPRYATADALLDYVNELQTREPVDHQTIRSLMYAENDDQRVLIELFGEMAPLLEFEHELRQRFSQGMLPINGSPLAAQSPATIVEREDRRVRAEYESSLGDIESLHFVQIGDRWHLSGYTLEYSFDEESDLSDMLNERETIREATQIIRDLLPALRRGEYQSFEDVQVAMGMEAMRRGFVPDGPTPR